MAEQIITQGVARQKDLLLEVLVVGRLAFLDHLPIEQHDLAQLL
jgi:hypothetical protein